jgi:hypothetical protein
MGEGLHKSGDELASFFLNIQFIFDVFPSIAKYLRLGMLLSQPYCHPKYPLAKIGGHSIPFMSHRTMATI